MRDRRRPSLDGVRGVAVVAVVLSHTGMPGAQGGGLGVLVFFVLSGYLITESLLARPDETAGPGVRHFYVRRARRLLPALAALVSITLVACWAGAGTAEGRRGSVHAFPGVLGFATNWYWVLEGQHLAVLGYFGHLWSLAVEEQFYLAWPWLLLALRRRPRALVTVLLSLLVAALGYRLWAIRSFDDVHLFYGTQAVMDQLVTGALVAVWRAGHVPPLAGAAAATSLVATVLVVRPATSLATFILVPTAVALLTGVLIASLRSSPSWALARLLGWAPLARLGRVSYGVYLWHVLVIVLLVPVGLPGWLLHVSVVVVSVALAELSFRWIEAPWLPRVRAS